MSGIRNKWLELNLTGALYNSKCIQNRPSQCLRKRTLFSYKKKKDHDCGYSVQRNLHGIQTHLSKLLLECAEK